MLLSQTSFFTVNFLTVGESRVISSGKEVKAMGVIKPNTIPARFAAPIHANWARLFEIQVSVYTIK